MSISGESYEVLVGDDKCTEITLNGPQTVLARIEHTDLPFFGAQTPSISTPAAVFKEEFRRLREAVVLPQSYEILLARDASSRALRYRSATPSLAEAPADENDPDRCFAHFVSVSHDFFLDLGFLESSGSSSAHREDRFVAICT